MIFSVFWILLIYLCIEDAIFYEINILITCLCYGLFMIFYSFYVGLIGLLLLFCFKNSKFIGEADLLFLPIGFFLSGYNINYFLMISILTLFFIDFSEKKAAMLFPIVLSSLISRIVF